MVEGRNTPDEAREPAQGVPGGGVYEWFQRGMKLLREGSPAAAAALLERAAEAEPGSRSVREGLARAQFNSRQYEKAADSFRSIVDANPTEDYAYFGLGLALWRTGDMEAAHEPLAIAVAMRPDHKDYVTALKNVRATLRAREAM
ncbi:hypothetical protein C1I98_27795 [Spongiactinospora gelatinilytica]|uniref:Uncharacterized protein n=1 Tax=Spongiactinospora gelatinilytica TaxID=2666298 RepID=A0A2W2FYD8_9ACTN|nr:tetratricopeptide repeat protein [Spongiactinospora gelatinilytica]PZG35139.1 hypothetical protein C1I98_27795 [Spongiactinospora gelatinilytica]